MTDLPLTAIERELLDLLHSLNLHMTVEKAGRIGELLEAARAIPDSAICGTMPHRLPAGDVEDSHGGFMPNYRPVLLYHKPPKPTWRCFSDIWVITKGENRHHRWEQPLEPWRHWVGGLAGAGDLV